MHTSTYNTTVDNVLFTVLDAKTVKDIAKRYQQAVDKAHNAEEEITARKMKTKIGKQFLLKEGQEDNLPKELDVEQYLNSQRNLIQRSIASFLTCHGWTKQQLCEYFTKTSQSIQPITEITVH